MKSLALIVFIIILCLPVPAIADEVSSLYVPVKFEKVMGPDTFQASGKLIKLWGIRGVDKDLPQYAAGIWFLEGLIKKDDLTCKLIEAAADHKQIMHCLIGSNDVGSMIVQMGLAEADGEYYAYEEQIAQNKKRGLWQKPESKGL